MARTLLIGLGLVGIALFLLGAPAAFAEARLEGQVVKTHLTACSTVPGKVGTCEGTLEVEQQTGGRVTMQITRDTLLKKGDAKAFLFQLEGSQVAVAYLNQGDQKVATSVVAEALGR